MRKPTGELSLQLCCWKRKLIGIGEMEERGKRVEGKRKEVERGL